MLYSTRNNPRSRSSEELSDDFIVAIWSEFDRLVNLNAFAKYFPAYCPDGNSVVGTDLTSLMGRIRAEILAVPFDESTLGSVRSNNRYSVDDLSAVTWDIVEFTLRYASLVIEGEYHSYFKHSHLRFDLEEGREQYRKFMNDLLATYGMAYKLNEEDQIVRIVPEAVSKTFRTIDGLGDLDEELGILIRKSQDLFLRRSLADNKDGLDKLWDAFERLKALNATSQKNKRASADRLISQMSKEESLREELNDESVRLTKIGNSYFIRHSEHYQTTLNSSAEVRYLYLRMLSFIYLAAESYSIKTQSKQIPIDNEELPF